MSTKLFSYSNITVKAGIEAIGWFVDEWSEPRFTGLED